MVLVFRLAGGRIWRVQTRLCLLAGGYACCWELDERRKDVSAAWTPDSS